MTCPTHGPHTSEACPQCFPALAAVNADLADVARQLQTARGAEWQALSGRYDDLRDARWALLPATGMYGDSTP